MCNRRTQRLRQFNFVVDKTTLWPNEQTALFPVFGLQPMLTTGVCYDKVALGCDAR
jgi:hypothetical protein